MEYINITEAVSFLNEALIDAEVVGDTEAIKTIQQAIALIGPLAA